MASPTCPALPNYQPSNYHPIQVVWLPHQIKRIKAEARVDWQSRNLTTIAKRDQKSVDYGGD